ncbi:TPA: hypothetical protein DCP81_01345 [Candidatus Azambacteria bacterium]|nr:hypothetical protein [Candidatus Azambacteria bacterium]
MREELQKICEERGFSAEEIERLFSFLARLNPPERQTLFLAFKGFPEYLPAFKDILAAKLDLASNPNPAKLANILSEEEKKLSQMINNLKHES